MEASALGVVDADGTLLPLVTSGLGVVDVDGTSVVTTDAGFVKFLLIVAIMLTHVLFCSELATVVTPSIGKLSFLSQSR